MREEPARVSGGAGLPVFPDVPHTGGDPFRRLVDTLRDGIYFTRNGIFTRVNPAMCEIFGLAEDELLGKPAWELARPENREHVRAEFLEMFRTGRYRPIDVECLRPDGSKVDVEVRVSGLTEDGAFGLVLDMTERRRLERALLDVSERERRAIRGNLHDDLGQVLTGLKLLGHVLRDTLREQGNALEPKAAEVAALADEAIRKTRNLASGFDPVEPVEEGLAVALRRMAESVGARMPRTRVAYVEPGPARVRGPRTANHLYRLAEEAVGNAARHAGAASIRVTLQSDDRQVVLAVEDDGNGVLPPGWEHTGMGMRIMKFRAMEIGGSLRVEAAPGRGTTVHCRCPNR